MNIIRKYPRTHHLEGSSIQQGDEDLTLIPFDHIRGYFCVIEEKMDGANCAISISDTGDLLLQSRGHYLTGGARERHFDLFKTWASGYTVEFRTLLSTRYILYGEWLYAKHTIYYTDLPHYFLEFDIFDKTTEKFLSTEVRKALLAPYPCIKSVPVLAHCVPKELDQLHRMITHSSYINNHLSVLYETCSTLELPFETILAETDTSDLMEGLYIKIEEDGYVQGRAKYVRPSFNQTIQQSEKQWLHRPIVPNRLATGVDIFSG